MDISIRQAVTQGGSEDSQRITFNVWDGVDSSELIEIMTEHLPAWAELFARKNSEYQDNAGTAFTLGERGQFSDMYRKMMKLKAAMWDGNESQLVSEGVDEIIKDLIGHCFLTLTMRARARGGNDKFIPKGDADDGSDGFGSGRSDGEKEDPFNMKKAYEKIDQMRKQMPPIVSYGVDMRANDIVTTGVGLAIALINQEGNGLRVSSPGAEVVFKQHLGKGAPWRILRIDPDRKDGMAICVVQQDPSDGSEEGAWVHPTWLAATGR